MKKILALLLTSVLILCGCTVKENNNEMTTVTENITVTVLGFGDEKLLEKTVDVEGEATALSALMTAAPGKVKQSSGVMPYVTEILGLKEREHGAMSGWTYKVNGESPMVGADKYILKSGDYVAWIYFTE